MNLLENLEIDFTKFFSKINLSFLQNVHFVMSKRLFAIILPLKVASDLSVNSQSREIHVLSNRHFTAHFYCFTFLDQSFDFYSFVQFCCPN